MAVGLYDYEYIYYVREAPGPKNIRTLVVTEQSKGAVLSKPKTRARGAPRSSSLKDI